MLVPLRPTPNRFTTEDVQTIAMPGDVLLVRGNRFIRMLTGESVSHVALIWVNKHKEVLEYTLSGFEVTELSTWLRKNSNKVVWWGMAPRAVDSTKVFTFATVHGFKKYSLYEYVLIWLAFCFGVASKVYGRVCSTFVQRVWEDCGLPASDLPMRPGKFLTEVDHLAEIV